MSDEKKSLYYIHIAVLLFGLAGLFGKIIELPAIIITLGRVVFATIGLGIAILFTKHRFKIKSLKSIFVLIFAGIILAFHWWSFFYSIQLSTVAIGLLTFSTFPVFTVFLEPVFFKEKLIPTNIIIAFFTFLGIFLIVPELNFQNAVFKGAFWGIMSGLSFSILQLTNRFLVKDSTGIQITFYEVLIASIALSPFLFFDTINFTLEIVFYLMLLGIVFTAVAHAIFISGLKHVDVFTSSVIASLEPVYGIILAIFIISEIPGSKTIIGGLIIVASNLLVLFIKKHKA